MPSCWNTLCFAWGGSVEVFVWSCHVLISAPHASAAPHCSSGSSSAARGSSSPSISPLGAGPLFPQRWSHTFPSSFVSKAAKRGCTARSCRLAAEQEMWVPQVVGCHCFILFYQSKGLVKGCSWLRLNLQALVGKGAWRSGGNAPAFGCCWVQGLAGPGLHLQNLPSPELVVVKSAFRNHWDLLGSMSLFVGVPGRPGAENASRPEGAASSIEGHVRVKQQSTKLRSSSEILWQQKSERRGWASRKFLICRDRKQSCVLSENYSSLFLTGCHMSAILMMAFLYKCSFTEMSSGDELQQPSLWRKERLRQAL